MDRTTTQDLIDPVRGEEIKCVLCGYCLSGLGAAARCPECGHVAMASRLAELSRILSRPYDSFLLVLDAMKWYRTLTYPDAESIRFSPLRVCLAVREYSIEQAGSADSAVELLSEFGIRRSEDIGAIVFAMVFAGAITVEPGDSPGGFDHLFTMEELLRAASSVR